MSPKQHFWMYIWRDPIKNQFISRNVMALMARINQRFRLCVLPDTNPFNYTLLNNSWAHKHTEVCVFANSTQKHKGMNHYLNNLLPVSAWMPSHDALLLCLPFYKNYFWPKCDLLNHNTNSCNRSFGKLMQEENLTNFSPQRWILKRQWRREEVNVN